MQDAKENNFFRGEKMFHKSIRTSVLSLLLCPLISLPVNANDNTKIIVIGDSWAQMIRTPLEGVLVAEGYSYGVVDDAISGRTSMDLSSINQLNRTTNTLNDHPNADLILLSIGGVERLYNLDESMTPQQITEFLEGIVSRVQTIVDHILSVRPEAQILHHNYDYPRPLDDFREGVDVGSPSTINGVMHEYFDLVSEYAENNDQLTVVFNAGISQLAYGFTGDQHYDSDPDYPIPAGDPSLPNPDLPSPHEAFRDKSHMHEEGFELLAQSHFDMFFGPLLFGSDGGSGNTYWDAIDYEDFSTNWGIWNSGGSDATLINIRGGQSIRLRDNSNTSIMTTDELPLSGYSKVRIDFDYAANSMESGQEFLLEISTDNGANFVVIDQWREGVEFEFLNGPISTDTVVIDNISLTNQTLLRFRCNAGNNSDKIFIDDIRIEAQ